MDLSILCTRRGVEGFIHIAKLVHRPCCCRCALFDVCAQFNKAFIFKTRWWLALIFSNNVQGFSLGAAEWHSSYCFICASGFYFVPVQNNKNIQVCLFAGLVSDKMNRFRSSFICVLQWKGSGGIKKELSVTWISVSLLFSGLCAFSWCGKNQTGRYCSLACIGVSVQKMIGVGLKCNHSNTTSTIH